MDELTNTLLQFAIDNPTFSTVVTVIAFLYVILTGLKPVIMYIVKKTETETDDMIVDRVYAVFDSLSEENKTRLKNRINELK